MQTNDNNNNNNENNIDLLWRGFPVAKAENIENFCNTLQSIVCIIFNG